MKISKSDALVWFDHFAGLGDEVELSALEQEVFFATLAQIERVVDSRHAELMAGIPTLSNLEQRTYFVGDIAKFPMGCRSCLFGSGLGAVRKTNHCNLKCDFCYNYGQLEDIPPVGADMWDIGGTKFYDRDIDLLLRTQNLPTGIAYVFLEPFMEIEKYFSVVNKFRNASIHQHMYTNGTRVNEEALQKLGAAGLNEIRFNLGASGCDDRVIAAMALAKRYIPSVGIETPMTPQFYRTFLKKKKAILNTGLDFINCAELHLNPNNIGNYLHENLYASRQGYISPIWSRELTLKLMRLAAEEKWDLVVHDCSNHTKFARGLNLGRQAGMPFGASNYACEFSRWPFAAFLPVLMDENFTFLIEEPLPPRYRPPVVEF